MSKTHQGNLTIQLMESVEGVFYKDFHGNILEGQYLGIESSLPPQNYLF